MSSPQTTRVRRDTLIAGTVLFVAVVFVAWGVGLIVTVSRLQDDIESNVSVTRRLGDLRQSVLAFSDTLAPGPGAPELASVRKLFNTSRRTFTDADAVFAGLLPSLERVDGCVSRMVMLQPPLASDRHPAEEVRVLRAEFDQQQTRAVREIERLEREARARLGRVSTRLQGLWRSLSTVALVGCALAVATSGLVFSHTREHRKRHAAEAALVESRDLFQGLVNGTSDVVFLKDRSFAYQFVNPSGLAHLDMTLEEAVGRTDFDLIAAENADLSRREDEQVLRGETVQNEKVILLRDIPRDFLVHKCPHYDAQGNVVGIIGIARDVTEYKAAEEKVYHSQRLASIGTLAAGLAHEINNPLGTIRFAAEELLEEGPPELRPGLSEIVEDVVRCGKIVRNMLHFSRDTSTDKASIDVNEVACRALELTGSEAAQKEVSVERDLDPDIPPVLGNPTGLGQVLVNLLTNAIQAVESGGHVLLCTTLRDSGVQVEVRDNGCGVPAEDQSRVFDPFFTTRLDEGGSGLGLSVCHGIVTDHGGVIEVRSEDGEGTTFTVTLPALERTRKKSAHG